MNATRPRRPRLEPLESKLLLNGAQLDPPDAVMAHVQTFRHGHRTPLAGVVRGSYAMPISRVPDAGLTQEFSGGGVIAPLGFVQAKGSLRLPGFINLGRAQGTMTLSNQTGGTLTLQLQGPLQKGFSPAPTHLTYKILSGTGPYQNLKGGGTANLDESFTALPPSTTLHSPLPAHGFTLTFVSGHK